VASAFETDGQAFDLTQPALVLGLGDPGEEVVVDFDESLALGGVWPQE
jgi:hypothetical protein